MSHSATADPHAADHDHAHHNPHLAHHFDSVEQQTETEKLGMWAFLGTEILMFGGLFVAYGVLRYNHPDVMLYGHEFLDKTLGAINTVILIASSFTMAVAVRCAQLNQRKLLIMNLVLTLLGGFGFLGIKFVEYKSKWEAALFPGRMNLFNQEYKGDKTSADAASYLAHHHSGPGHDGTAADPGAHDLTAHGKDASKDAHATDAAHAADGSHVVTTPATAHPATAALRLAVNVPAGSDPASTSARSGYIDPNAGSPDEAKIRAPFVQPLGTLALLKAGSAHAATPAFEQLPTLAQYKVNTFFSIYFIMTGLHGLHVVIGMGLIAWVLLRSIAGHFSSEYFIPVDLVGLYWHLVDLIWIFLFPLLYLIH
jgi:cytochrome c oxidase subunit 3